MLLRGDATAQGWQLPPSAWSTEGLDLPWRRRSGREFTLPRTRKGFSSVSDVCSHFSHGAPECHRQWRGR